MGDILSRINKIAEAEGITITSLEKKIGASKGVLSRALSKKSDIQSKWIQSMVENYPLYDAEWLLTGKGDMLKSDSPAPPIHNVNVEPSPGSQASPKSPEPISVDFSLILECYEYLAGEAARLKDEKARTDALQAEIERLQVENRELRTENDELKKHKSRPYSFDIHADASPSLMVAEPEAEYK
jgi:hypothetical protein